MHGSGRSRRPSPIAQGEIGQTCEEFRERPELFRVFSSIFKHSQPQRASEVDLTLQKRKPVTDCTRVLEGRKRFIFGRYAAHLSHLYSFNTFFILLFRPGSTPSR